MFDVQHRKRVVLLLSVAVMISAAEATKADSPSQAARNGVMAIVIIPSSDYTQAGRARLADAVATYCRSTLAAIPSNTPSEDAWVKEEGRTTDMNKINRLVRSAEYSRYWLKDHFSTCVDRAEKLVSVQGSEGRREAARLISLAILFNESADDAKFYTKHAGLSLEALGLELDIDLFSQIRRGLLVSALRAIESSPD